MITDPAGRARSLRPRTYTSKPDTYHKPGDQGAGQSGPSRCIRRAGPQYPIPRARRMGTRPRLYPVATVQLAVASPPPHYHPLVTAAC
eukprot:scaffold46293_cov70-Phaeocystis_antarctica.AAC.8